MSRTPARFSGRSLPAALLAVVVLLVAMAGSATAAKLITSKQIKNNTITSQDVKNGSLQGADVRNNSIASADVKNGSIGVGDLAASAKPQVRFEEGSDFNLPTCDDTGLGECAPVVGVPLPKGTWVVTANVTVDNFAGGASDLSNRCGLFADGTLAEARTPLNANGAPGEAESLFVQDVLKTIGTTAVSLRCTEMAGENFRVGSPEIVALKVG